MTDNRRNNRSQRRKQDFHAVIQQGRLAAIMGNSKCPYRAEPVQRAWLKGYNEERERMQIRELLDKEREQPKEGYEGHFR